MRKTGNTYVYLKLGLGSLRGKHVTIQWPARLVHGWLAPAARVVAKVGALEKQSDPQLRLRVYVYGCQDAPLKIN